MAPSKEQRRSVTVFLAVLAGLTLFRAWLAAVMPLTGEEAYYWSWSLAPDLSYFDHPPLIAWVIRLGTAVFGTSPFGVRACGLVLHVGAALLVFRAALRLFDDKRAAAWAGGLFTTAVFFGALANLMIPDAPLMFCWALAVCLLIEAIRPGRQRMWVAVGFALGLCALAKFHAILLPAALGLLLLISPAQRRHLRSGWLYLGAVIALAMALPIFLWNAQNGWPSFGFQLSSRHEWTLGSPVYLAEMLLTPFGYIGLVTYPLCIAGAIWGVREWRRRGRDDLLLVSLICLVPIGFFLILSTFMRIDPQWAAPGYVGGVTLAAGLGMALRRQAAAQWWKRLLLPAAAGTGLLVLALGYAVLIVVQFCPRLVPSKDIRLFRHRRRFRTEYLNRFYGWEEIGRRLRRTLDGLKAEHPAEPFIVYRAGYGTAASIHFYTPGQPRVYLFREPAARGLQYSIWETRADLAGRNAVVIARLDKGVDLAGKNAVAFSRVADTVDLKWLQEHFVYHDDEAEVIEVHEGGRLRQRFVAVRAYHFRPPQGER